MAFRSQEGIRSAIFGNGSAHNDAIDYSTDNLFAGTWRLDQDNLNRFDPFIGGYAAIIWTKLPAFFDKATDNTNGTNIKTQFKYFTERNFKSLSGVGDLTLETDNLSNGFAGNELGVATNMKKENTSFTLRHYELAGSPVRELYQYWITGIRDPETGVATYHGAIANGMPYSMKNHTGELLYVVTDPSFAGSGDDGTGAGDLGKAIPNSIEFAGYWTNSFPTKIPQDHLNYTSGDHAIPEIDIEYRGNFHFGGSVNKLAVKAMEKYRFTYNYGSYGELGRSMGSIGSGVYVGLGTSEITKGYEV